MISELFAKHESGAKQSANTRLCVGVHGLFVRIHLYGQIVQELL